MKIAPVNQWVKAAIARSGLSQAALGRRLSEQLRREIDRAAVNKMLTGERGVAADEMLAIEAITGLAAPSVNAPTQIPLLDWVSAGKLTEPKSQISVENVPFLVFFDLGRGDFFALHVQGDSMDRVSPDGSVIVVNRAERTLHAGKAYVFCQRGETTYKLWEPDPPHLAPFSTNPVNKPIFLRKGKDLEVIGRVVRTMLNL